MCICICLCICLCVYVYENDAVVWNCLICSKDFRKPILEVVKVIYVDDIVSVL